MGRVAVRADAFDFRAGGFVRARRVAFHTGLDDKTVLGRTQTIFRGIHLFLGPLEFIATCAPIVTS